MKNLIRIFFKVCGPALISLVFFGMPQHAGAVVILNCGDANSSFGTSCSLGELNEGGSFIINDKEFRNWELGFFAGSFDSEAIRVDLIDNLIRPGFTLFDTGISFRADDGATIRSELTYEINILGGPFNIVGADLTVQFGEIGGSSSASVSEDVADGASNLLTTLSASCNNPQCANSGAGFESPLFAPQNLLLTLKDIDLISGSGGGIAEIQSITQLFTQQEQVAIPEPRIFTLMLTAMTLSLPWLCYRSSKKACAAQIPRRF